MLSLFAPAQIARIKVMIPKIILFQSAPVLVEKSYTHGEMMSQIPINPVSQSCHIINTPFKKLTLTSILTSNKIYDFLFLDMNMNHIKSNPSFEISSNRIACLMKKIVRAYKIYSTKLGYGFRSHGWSKYQCIQ